MADTSSGYPCYHCPKTFSLQSGLASHVLSAHMGCAEEESSLDGLNGLGHKSETSEYTEDQTPPNMSPLPEEFSDFTGGTPISYDEEDKSSATEDTKDLAVNEVTNIIQCSRCGLQFPDYGMLKVHTETVHLGLKYQAEDVMDSSELDKVKHESKFFPCMSCASEFEDSLTLRNHIEVSHRGIGMQICCKFCGLRKSKIRLLELHVQQCYLNPDRKYSMSDIEDEMAASCKQCGKSYECEKTLKTHDCRHSNDCSVASVKTEKPDNEIELTELTYRCSFCTLQFPSFKLKTAHEREHPPRCSPCDKSFASLGGFRTHFTKHCKFCNKYHSHKDTLKTHMDQCILNAQRILSTNQQLSFAEEGLEPEKHQCEFCGITEKLLPQLQIHMEVCMSNPDRISSKDVQDQLEMTLHRCQYCEECFLHKSNLKTHEKKHTGECLPLTPFICKVCDKGFADSGKLRKHGLVHSDDMPFSCAVCHRCFKRKASLKTHMKVHEKSCKSCDKTFVTQEDLSSHQCENKTLLKPFMCETCGISFTVKFLLKSHMTIHVKDRFLYCEFCSKALVNQKAYDKHIEAFHSGQDPPYQCEECGKRYWNKGGLKIHTKSIHQQIFLYHCKHCNKGYNNKTLLEDHERKHIGEKPFQCKDCDQTFISKYNLLTHQERNHQEKNLLCPQCPKTFSVMKLLHSHIFNKHSDEKPFSCDQCSYTCKTGPNLKIHSRTHSDERPYKCEVCAKDFRTIHSLKTHKMIHTGEKPFSCQVCQRKFRHKQAMQVHERQHD